MLPGPMPGETLACLMALEIPVRFIHGNGDRVVTTQLAGGDISEGPAGFREVIHWTAQQLDADQRRFVASWPATDHVEISGLGLVPVLPCHAAQRHRVLHAPDGREAACARVRRGQGVGGRLRPYAHAVRPHGRRASSGERRQRWDAICSTTGRVLAPARIGHATATYGLRLREGCRGDSRNRVSAEGSARGALRPESSDGKGNARDVRRCRVDLKANPTTHGTLV